MPNDDNSMMHPDNFGPVSLILLMRIYDVLISNLGTQNPQVAEKLIKAHEAGEFLSPPPRMVEYEEDSE